MHANECWSCRDSRAVCNRVRPRCSKCAKSNRPCQYGLRLSWPKATSTKRSLTHSVQGGKRIAKRFSQASFVNATSWDIQLHDYLRMNQGLGNHQRFLFQRLDPPIVLSWLPINLGYEERELIDHFICMASSILAIFDPDKNEFMSLLLRMALSDNSPSSMAVLQSALALSLFHRHGLQADVFRFKARALRTLITSCNHTIERPTLVQHIAARMILCHLEMLEMSNDVSLWFCHLSEAKHLIDNVGVGSQNFHGEFSKLLAWVEYHMVTSRFSLRHWHINAEPINGIQNFAPAEQETCLSRKIKDASFYSHEILRHLYITFEIIRKPTNSLYHSDEYENSLRCLENRITSIVPSALKGISNTVSGLNTAWMAMMELFKLAALIYLKSITEFLRTLPAN